MPKTMRHLLTLTLALGLAMAAPAQTTTHEAVMRTGELRLVGPSFDSDGVPANFQIGTTSSGGVNFSLGADWSWAGGPALASTLGFGNRDAVLIAGGSSTLWLFGDVRVGLPTFGGGSLTVKNGITAAGSPVARWRGRLSADPASPLGGDTYRNTGTGKVRLYDGAAWVDLN